MDKLSRIATLPFSFFDSMSDKGPFSKERICCPKANSFFKSRTLFEKDTCMWSRKANRNLQNLFPLLKWRNAHVNPYTSRFLRAREYNQTKPE